MKGKGKIHIINEDVYRVVGCDVLLETDLQWFSLMFYHMLLFNKLFFMDLFKYLLLEICLCSAVRKNWNVLISGWKVKSQLNRLVEYFIQLVDFNSGLLYQF